MKSCGAAPKRQDGGRLSHIQLAGAVVHAHIAKAGGDAQDVTVVVVTCKQHTQYTHISSASAFTAWLNLQAQEVTVDGIGVALAALDTVGADG